MEVDRPVWFVGLTCWNGRGVGWETQGRRDGWTQSLMRTCLNETSFCLCLQEDSCKEDVIQHDNNTQEKYEFGTKQQEIYIHIF